MINFDSNVRHITLEGEVNEVISDLAEGVSETIKQILIENKGKFSEEELINKIVGQVRDNLK